MGLMGGPWRPMGPKLRASSLVVRASSLVVGPPAKWLLCFSTSTSLYFTEPRHTFTMAKSRSRSQSRSSGSTRANPAKDPRQECSGGGLHCLVIPKLLEQFLPAPYFVNQESKMKCWLCNKDKCKLLLLPPDKIVWKCAWCWAKQKVQFIKSGTINAKG